MQIFAINQLNPIFSDRISQQFRAEGFGFNPIFEEESFSMHWFLSNPSAREIAAVREQPIYCAFRDIEGVLVGWVTVGDALQIEYSYNAFPLREHPELHPRAQLAKWGRAHPGAEPHWPVLTTLTDLDTGLVKAVRLGTLNKVATRFLTNHIQTQLDGALRTEEFIQTQLTRLRVEFPSFKEGMASATVRCRLGTQLG